MKKFAPDGRIVEYERGYAVQVRTSGPYLNKSGKTEENEMNEKNKLKPGVKFDFRLFDPEDSPGSDKANDDMNKEIQKAVRM